GSVVARTAAAADQDHGDDDEEYPTGREQPDNPAIHGAGSYGSAQGGEVPLTAIRRSRRWPSSERRAASPGLRGSPVSRSTRFRASSGSRSRSYISYSGAFFPSGSK